MDLSNVKELFNTSPKSDVVADTPLSLYLYIVTHSRRECYTNYMEGARILLDWLDPVYTDLHDIDSIKVPELLVSYEYEQLIKILVPPQTGKTFEERLYAMKQVEVAIYLCLTQAFTVRSNYSGHTR